MKRETINYFSVGLFVLAGLAVLLIALYHLIGGVGDRDVYYTSYRNVAGLSPGTLVTYEGYTLGYVSAIEPQRTAEGMRYQVEMQLQQGWQIPDDSVARIYSGGLLADTVVNISEGRSAAFLEPGGVLKGEQGVDLFATMGELAGDISDLSEHTVRPLLESLNHSVQQVGGELETRLPVILDNVQELVAKLDRSATHLSGMLNADTEAQARRALNNIDHAAADFQALSQGLVEVKRDAQRLIVNLDTLITQSQPDLQQAVADLRHILQQVSRYSDGILQNLDSTSRNMSEFSRQIRENPGRLLGGSAPSDKGGRRE
jgi:phospholipid/cholesterol/gamma-HCH transport system substrate-binding protein